jgi:hypothetical protein
MRLGAAIGLAIFTAASVGADEVYLVGGGRVSGIVVDETDTSVEVEIGAGHVTVARSGVDHIVRTRSPLATYHAKAQALADNDVAGWLALAEWARRSELGTQAREAYSHVLEIAPDNPVAHRALGEVMVSDHWMTRDAAMQAQGYVLMDGEWVSPEQRAAILADREAARRDRMEAAAEQRTALEDADARARAAATQTADAPVAPGIVVGGYGFVVPGYDPYAAERGHRSSSRERDGERRRSSDRESREHRPQQRVPQHIEYPSTHAATAHVVTPASALRDEEMRRHGE